MIRAAILSALLAFAAAEAGAPPVAPVTIRLSYPNATTAVIRAPNGKPVYRLGLVVDGTANRVASNLSLVLLPVRAGFDSDNLLDPPGRWHGYQPYFFASDDFKNGAEKSFFGPVREFCRDATGLNTVIAVKRVAVGKSRDPLDLEFRALVLDVTIKPGRLVRGKPVCD